MSPSDLVITPMSEGDLDPLAMFMREQNDADTNPERLRHWYLENPSARSTVMIGRIDGRIAGMSTTNGHRFQGPEGEVIVAMPQKVLTDTSLRGKGIFQGLYRATENAERGKGAAFFLTVTNAASTPIFLGRFGYMRLPSPRISAFLPAWGRVEGEVPHLPWSMGFSVAMPGGVWRMVKDAAHYEWRYSAFPHKGHQHHAFSFGTGEGAHIILKPVVRKGIPVMLLLDLLGTSEDAARKALANARRLARRSGCRGVMALRTAGMEIASKGMVRLGLSSGLNLLVKGLDQAHTERLAQQRFELAFGDLDFL